MSEWKNPERELPADGQRVVWLNSAGRESLGVYRNRLWWIGQDGDPEYMYIYYVPTFWRDATSPEEGGA